MPNTFNPVLHYCCYCSKTFVGKKTLSSHLMIKHSDKKRKPIQYKCDLCPYVNKKRETIFQHVKREHNIDAYKCTECDQRFTSTKRLQRHVKSHGSWFGNSFVNVTSAHNEAYSFKRLYIKDYSSLDIEVCLGQQFKKCIKKELKIAIKKHRYIKVGITLRVQFKKNDEMGQLIQTQVIPLASHHYPFLISSLYDFDDFLQNYITELENRREAVELAGSGWSLNFIKSIDLHCINLSLIGGCAKKSELELPPSLEELCYNPNYETNDCFSLSVAAGYELNVLKKSTIMDDICPQKQYHCLKETFKSYFSSKGIKLPVSIKDLPKFEKQNTKLKIGFNVFTYTGKDLFPLYISKQSKDFTKINLLLIQPKKKSLAKTGHFVLILSLHNLIQRIRKIKSNLKATVYVCEHCLHIMHKESEYQSHLNVCGNKRQQNLQYPKKDSNVEFDKTSAKQFKAPFIAFADFEAKMSPKSREENGDLFNCNNCRNGGPPKLCSHSERIECEQIPMTYSIYVFSSEGKLVLEKTYSSDENLMEHFFKTLETFEKELGNLLQRYKTLHWTDRLQKLFDKELVCHICGVGFIPKDKDWGKVRDHCHRSPPVLNEKNELESIYVGAAHAKCNLARRDSGKFPMFIHNLMSYDSNFILGHLNQKQIKKVSGIPYNTNKLRVINLGNWTLLDSYQLLSGSLAELADDLAKSDDCEFNLIKQAKLAHSNEQLNLLLRKNVYPYEWVRSVEQLKLSAVLPTRAEFFSSIKQSTISEEDYQHGQNVFSQFSCKNMLEYTELYCKLDTLLLAEIMFSFRELIFKEFKLAVENYISTPQLAFDACLKLLDEPIGLMSDPTMVNMIEQNIRGGVSFVNNRHTTSSSENGELLYLDANNLYGYAQSLPVPVGEYNWISQADFLALDWSKMSLQQDYGYFVEADLIFPEQIHDKLDNLPLAPQTIPLHLSKLSPYSQLVQNELKGAKAANQYVSEKLVTGLESKERYVMHYMNLKYYLELGAQLGKIYSVISFRQKNILKKYIQVISQKRAQAKTDFKKRLFKLLANALYGKFIQDVRKYTQVKFAKTPNQLSKYVNNPHFISATNISKNMTMVFLRSQNVVMDRLYGIGFTILEASKLFMYAFWYDVLYKQFGSDLQLSLTDTDSFIFQVKNKTKLDVLSKIGSVMDFSNFPNDHPLYSSNNKKKPGYFKDEYPVLKIDECVAVKSKCYSLKFENTVKTQNVCKGTSSAVSKHFTLKQYKDCIYKSNAKIKSTATMIRAKKNVIRTITLTKLSMSSGDDKRFLLCNIHSVPYGSYHIKMYLTTQICHKCKQQKRNQV